MAQRRRSIVEIEAQLEALVDEASNAVDETKARQAREKADLLVGHAAEIAWANGRLELAKQALALAQLPEEEEPAPPTPKRALATDLYEDDAPN